MSKYRSVSAVAIMILMLSVGVLPQADDSSGLRDGSIDFVDCVDCNDRLLYIPFVEYGYVPAGAHEYSGKVLIQVEVTEAGRVTNAIRISGHPLFGAKLSKTALAARFEMSADNGKKVAEKLVLAFRITAAKDVEEKKLPIINGMGAPVVVPEFHGEEKRICVSREVRVRVRYHSYWGRVVSAKAISGDPSLFESSEKAALEIKIRFPNVDPNPNSYFSGIFISTKPRASNCPLVVAHRP